MSNRNLAAFALAMIGGVFISYGFGYALKFQTLDHPIKFILGGGVAVIVAILIHKMELP